MNDDDDDDAEKQQNKDEGKKQHKDDAGKQQQDPSFHMQRRTGVRRAERDEKPVLLSCPSSENLESIIYHDTRRADNAETPWSKKEIEVALLKLPGGDTALFLIPTLRGDALQKVLEEFQCVTLNKNEDRKHNISLVTCADENEENTILVDENRAAATTTPGQLLAGWPDTCLLISSWLSHVEIAKALLDKGAPVSTTDNDGRTPLHLAACTTSTKIVEELLKHSADPCEWDFENKYTPLHCAAAAGCVATVTCLIKSGAHVNVKRSPLYYAMLNNAVDCVETLLQAGARPDNSQVLLLQADASPDKAQVYTKTPLHVAVTLGNVHCIKLLLDHGANVTIQMGTTKSTPLHLAV
ncbi:Transient receptor potential channel pyrexia [Camponotus floridanus]|uniref:Transient receptor potential channel pyrexia n=1 Tax=Camponotus floridanus TaxID=104421 RepID=E2ALA3_CAMFO|nr:Transient receptor potential channel pyrexia [Camponotus floridanus]